MISDKTHWSFLCCFSHKAPENEITPQKQTVDEVRLRRFSHGYTPANSVRVISVSQTPNSDTGIKSCG